KTTFSSRGRGPYKKESIELFDYVRRNINDDELIIFRKPRVLYLYTGKRAGGYYRWTDVHELYEFRDYMDLVGASVLIVDHTSEGSPPYPRYDFIERFAKKYKDGLRELYSNSDFTVYRVIWREDAGGKGEGD
ncbi:MAG: hypothetical protein V3T30_01780, partial [Thermodesulfobacteriota bacterium]